jgi:hypothetical protein
MSFKVQKQGAQMVGMQKMWIVEHKQDLKIESGKQIWE